MFQPSEAQNSAREVEMCQPPESDGDGVPNDRDQCPGKLKGVKVDAKGCILDTDGVGVKATASPTPLRRILLSQFTLIGV